MDGLRKRERERERKRERARERGWERERGREGGGGGRLTGGQKQKEGTNRQTTETSVTNICVTTKTSASLTVVTGGKATLIAMTTLIP